MCLVLGLSHGLGYGVRLRDFLLLASQRETLNEGRLADDALRQTKNIFIGTVTMVGKDGAIPGGMDEEQAYQLIDTYIQECEPLTSVNAVMNLQFNMVIDFTARTGQAKVPEGISSEVYRCMRFISNHVSEGVRVDDVAAEIDRSRAYTTARFRSETGMSISEYATACRVREAKGLLRHSSLSLAQISSLLHFSSQPHFQTVFKRACGVTPLQYRRGGGEG